MQSRLNLTRLYKSHTTRRKRLPAKPASSSALRLVSYNVHGGNAYSDAPVGEGRLAQWKLLKDLDPTVMCLQEVTDPLGLGEFGAFHELVKGWGNAIVSKYPLRDVCKIIYAATKLRGLMGATFTHPAMGDVRVYVTHLDVFDESERTRLAQVEELEGRIQEEIEALSFNGIVLLCGDFNAVHKSDYSKEYWEWILLQDQSRNVETQTDAMARLLESGNWTDTFHESPPAVSTWSLRRVDYCLLRNGSFPLDVAVSPWIAFDCSSDHLPVGVDLFPRRG